MRREVEIYLTTSQSVSRSQDRTDPHLAIINRTRCEMAFLVGRRRRGGLKLNWSTLYKFTHLFSAVSNLVIQGT